MRARTGAPLRLLYTQLPADTPEEIRVRFRSLVSSAEAASCWLCEVCGRAGRTRGRTRIRTLCETHRRWGVHDPDDA